MCSSDLLPVIKRMSRNLVGIGQSEFDGLIEKGVSILEATSKELAQQGTEQVQAGRVQRAKAAQDMSQTLRNDISAK